MAFDNEAKVQPIKLHWVAVMKIWRKKSLTFFYVMLCSGPLPLLVQSRRSRLESKNEGKIVNSQAGWWEKKSNFEEKWSAQLASAVGWLT